jgi:hypothetical protein
MRELNVVIGVAALDSGPNGFGATYVQWSKEWRKMNTVMTTKSFLCRFL